MAHVYYTFATLPVGWHMMPYLSLAVYFHNIQFGIEAWLIGIFIFSLLKTLIFHLRLSANLAKTCISHDPDKAWGNHKTLRVIATAKSTGTE